MCARSKSITKRQKWDFMICDDCQLTLTDLSGPFQQFWPLSYFIAAYLLSPSSSQWPHVLECKTTVDLNIYTLSWKSITTVNVAIYKECNCMGYHGAVSFTIECTYIRTQDLGSLWSTHPKLVSEPPVLLRWVAFSNGHSLYVYSLSVNS